MADPIDFANLTKVPYEQTAQSLMNYSMSLQQLRQKEGSEARTAGIQQQQANTQQQQVSQEGEYNQGQLANQQQATAQQGEYLRGQTAIGQQEQETARQRLNLDGTRDLGTLAMQMKSANIADQQNQQNLLEAKTKFGWAGQDEAYKLMQQQDAADMGKKGLEGMQQYYIKYGQPDKALALSNTQNEVKKGVLDNEELASNIKDSNVRHEAFQTIGMLGPALAAINNDPDPKHQVNSIIEMADKLDVIHPGMQLGNMARQDPQSGAAVLNNLYSSYQSTFAQKMQNPLDKMDPNVQANLSSVGQGAGQTFDMRMQQRATQAQELQNPLVQMTNQYRDLQSGAKQLQQQADQETDPKRKSDLLLQSDNMQQQAEAAVANFKINAMPKQYEATVDADKQNWITEYKGLQARDQQKSETAKQLTTAASIAQEALNQGSSVGIFSKLPNQIKETLESKGISINDNTSAYDVLQKVTTGAAASDASPFKRAQAQIFEANKDVYKEAPANSLNALSNFANSDSSSAQLETKIKGAYFDKWGNTVRANDVVKHFVDDNKNRLYNSDGSPGPAMFDDSYQSYIDNPYSTEELQQRYNELLSKGKK